MEKNQEDIQNVWVISTDPTMKSIYKSLINKLGLKQIDIESPTKLDIVIDEIRNVPASAVICDYQLRDFLFQGDVLATRLYQLHIPVILHVHHLFQFDHIRHLRSQIPVAVQDDEINGRDFKFGVKTCFSEFSGVYEPSRKLWRALICFRELNDQYAYVNVPSADPKQEITLLTKHIPEHVVDFIDIDKDRFRVYAQVNIGAENIKNLYFTDWSTSNE